MSQDASGRNPAGGARIVGDSPNFSGPGPQVMAAATLQGETVLNPQGENLGEIQDIMIDVPSGRIAYAVLSFGGVLGLGNKLFAIPWSALTLDAQRECFILDIDRERLARAQGFDKSHWPSMPDPGWTDDQHSFYRRSPPSS
ncbi:MAG TPA: PRC-barrel domain-containing protein [Noviherbaspirillum sp.]|uniref:PRC-barrel domain-containing protein n=1 Tax=Noviherbaspirillum sp. TaxID=1926288 RepID=UPI002D46E407|nr:PRC-barrel domain-containing protein [Noviherbaspirillum sp.]HYD94870.1 PRC-barrel domain-containing protein [Noviherbaspirillum sp.]